MPIIIWPVLLPPPHHDLTTVPLKTWLAYATANGLPILPIDPIALRNCLSELADSSRSFAAISTLVAAVARYHWDRFLPSPFFKRGFIWLIIQNITYHTEMKYRL